MRLLGLTTLALLGACNPNYGEGGFACSNGQCPSGYTCVSAICQKSGIPGIDATAKLDHQAVDRAPDRALDSCTKVQCWPDPDNDGFAGPNAIASSACNSCPAGTTSKDPKLAGNADCQPANGDVFPGQMKFFEGSYCQYCVAPCPCTASWDYNCDGKVDPKFPNLAGACAKLGLVGCSGEGWTGGMVPACGASAQFQSCAVLTCAPSTGMKTQACR